MVGYLKERDSLSVRTSMNARLEHVELLGIDVELERRPVYQYVCRRDRPGPHRRHALLAGTHHVRAETARDRTRRKEQSVRGLRRGEPDTLERYDVRTGVET